MGRIEIVIPDDLETEFRREAIRKFGMKKGYLKSAVEEAMRTWLQSQKSSEG